MSSAKFVWAIAALSVLALPTLAIGPPMPATTSGTGDQGMKHIMVSLAGTALSVHIDTPPATPVVMMSGAGQDYEPSKFDVLESVYFNAQYGWMPEGFFNLPANRSIWIERTSATQPVGSLFMVYEAGNGMEGMAAWTMNEIYTHDSFRWQWDGAMQHDYYTATKTGDYAMAFTVYVGDSAGTPDLTFTPATALLEFAVVPEPIGLSMASLGLALFTMRRTSH